MMQAIYSEAIEPRAIFSPLPQPPFAARLARALADGTREFAHSPLAYLRTAFLPERLGDWLPARIIRALGWLFTHPLSGLGGLLRRERMPVGFINPTTAHAATFVTNALSPVPIKAEPHAWDRFAATLLASGAAHGVLIVVLVYLTIANMLAPFTNVRIVDRPYRPFGEDQVAQLYARSRPVQQPTDKVLSIEELEARERQRALERERHRAEEEARLKAEREKAERERAEREAKEAEEKAKAEEAAKAAGANGPMKFGEINEAAIRDLISKMFERYKSGDLDAGTFSVMISFKIDCDGSMPPSSIHVDKSSPPDPKKEDLARKILWLIGESHALGPLCQFSSNSIAFEMDDNITRLTITGFGLTPEWTNDKAVQLRALFGALSWAKGNTDTGKLAKLVKIRTTSKRLDLDLTMSRASASELMRARFGGNPQ
ncbi:MAG: hypothetical protein ACJ74J_01680 [Blastocatellia bacterium]